MANKSFVIQYVIRAREQYAKVADKVTAATKRMDKSTKDYMKTATAMGAKMRKSGAIMTAAITLPAMLAAKSLINAASDAEETKNKFAEVFKGLDAEGAAAVQSLSKNYKLATSTSQDLLSNTGDLLVGLGLTREKALELSKSVIELSADVASFKNVEGGTARATNALTKALLGEREMLKETFKTAVLENEVKAVAAKLMAKNTKLTLQQAKALATLEIVTTRNKDAIGDFNRTMDGYANQARINEESNKRLRESFGRILLPLATIMIKVFTKLADSIEALSPSGKKAVLFGIAFLAVLGPLLLAIGGVIAILPALTAGMAVLGTLAGVTVGPLALGAAALAAAAVLIVTNWSKVKPILDPLLDIGKFFAEKLVDRLQFAWKIIKGIGQLIGQVVAAITTLDFSQFDLGSIKDMIFGAEEQGKTASQLSSTTRSNTRAAISSRSDKIDVGVNVGLDKGLVQTTPTATTRSQVRSRRRDVGSLVTE